MSPKSTLLLVEDDDSIRQSLVFILEPDFAVIESESIEAATRQIEALDEIEVLVTDLDLGSSSGHDGVTVATAFRTRFPNAPVLLLSATHSSNPRVLDLLAMGRSDFLRKPFDTEALFSKIEKLLRAAVASA